MQTEEELKHENETLKVKLSALETQQETQQEAVRSKNEYADKVRRIRLYFSFVVAYLLMVTISLFVMMFSSKSSRSSLDKISEEPNPNVGITNVCGRIEFVRDTANFQPSFEEGVQLGRVEQVSVPLSEVVIDKNVVNAFFVQRNNPALKMLRFRIGLKNGFVVEACIMRDSGVIAYSRIMAPVDVKVCDITCFRHALYGREYANFVKTELRKNGISNVAGNIAAECQEQILTDEEAWIVFQHVCEGALGLQYDWDRAINICFIGMWDRNHPILSLFAVMGFGLLILILNGLIRPWIEKFGQFLSKKLLPQSVKRVLAA